MSGKRQYNLDYLRILASFMVILLHASAQQWDKVPLTSVQWCAFNIYNTMVRCSVPVFFMISGKLFLSKKEVSVKSLLIKNILPIVLIYFLWSFLYAVDTIGLISLFTEFDFERLVHAFCNSKYHLWYMTSLASIYFFVPIFIAVRDYKEGKFLNYICILVFIFGIAVYSATLFPIDENVKSILNKVRFPIAVYPGYFVLGYVVDKYKDKFKKIKSFLLVILYFVFVLFVSALTMYFSINSNKADSTFYSNSFILTYFESVILFILFIRIKTDKLKDKTSAFLVRVSKYTRFVYLFHPFVLGHFYQWFGFNTLSVNSFLAVPFVALSTFLISLVVAFLIDRVPFVNKIFL